MPQLGCLNWPSSDSKIRRADAESICKDFHTDENDDCLASCVSQSCYAEIYAANPLEPGEVDRERQNKFNGCVKREQDEEKKQKAQEKRESRKR